MSKTTTFLPGQQPQARNTLYMYFFLHLHAPLCESHTVDHHLTTIHPSNEIKITKMCNSLPPLRYAPAQSQATGGCILEQGGPTPGCRIVVLGYS